MVNKSYTNFEEQLREAVIGVEVPYDASSWAGMEQKLDSKAFKAKLTKAGLIAASVAVIAIVTFFVMDDDSSQLAIENIQPVTEQGIIKENAEVVQIEKDQTTTNNNLTENNSHEDQIVKINNVEENDNKSNEVVKDNTPLITETKKEIIKQPVQKKEVKPNTIANEIAELEGFDMLNASFSAAIQSACKYVQIQFNTEETGAKKYTWEFGDGTTSNKQNPTHSYSEAGAYTVKLTVQGKNINSRTSRSIPAMITIHKSPIADFEWKASSTMSYDQSLSFENKSFDGVNSYWKFGDSSTDKEMNPKHTFQQKGNYTVQLITVNAFGCGDTVEQKVPVIKDYNLLAPNVFSPNGDGINDTWIPVALKFSDADFTVNVIDPVTGKVVFTTSNKSFEWDGRILGGGTVPSGKTYIWVASVKEGNGKAKQYKGSIIIK